MSRHVVITTINGKRVEEESVDCRTTLADFLRHRMKLTGTHVGCEHGVCGACTVLIDGRSARACLTLAVQVNDHTVTTVEGLADPGGDLHPIQQAFIDHHALQCGFCTPGFLMTLAPFVAAADPAQLDDASIREALAGNLCRCTGYQNIVKAVRLAVERIHA